MLRSWFIVYTTLAAIRNETNTTTIAPPVVQMTTIVSKFELQPSADLARPVFELASSDAIDTDPRNIRIGPNRPLELRNDGTIVRRVFEAASTDAIELAPNNIRTGPNRPLANRNDDDRHPDDFWGILSATILLIIGTYWALRRWRRNIKRLWNRIRHNRQAEGLPTGTRTATSDDLIDVSAEIRPPPPAPAPANISFSEIEFNRLSRSRASTPLSLNQCDCYRRHSFFTSVEEEGEPTPEQESTNYYTCLTDGENNSNTD